MGKIKKIREKKLNNQELDAEEAVLDDLFYDLYRNRGRVYKINFIRGIFFGLGTFLGGTVLITVLITVLSWLANVFPGFSEYIYWIITSFHK